MIFIHDQHFDFRSAVAASAENDGEDAEEDDRQNETQRERSPVTAQGNDGRTNDGGDHDSEIIVVKSVAQLPSGQM